ncbi:MAG: hypothetical protein PW843_16505 [Azospirillaceae bacterium]|nr:hypothetical protein [Azospirillaceae bacterium]
MSHSIVGKPPRNLATQVRQDAKAAAAEIIADSHHQSLGNISIRELLEEGRREWVPSPTHPQLR